MSNGKKLLSRRQFLSQSAIAGVGVEISSLLPRGFAQVTREELTCDVLVCAATPSGIAAAITAARLGRQVILAEYEDHIGGIVSNGLTNTDLDPNKRNAVGGFFNEYTSNIVNYYTKTDPGGPGAPNLAACHQGFFYEAKVAELVFGQMLRAEGANIRLLLQHELVSVDAGGGRVRRVTFRSRKTQQSVHVAAKVCIDATYEGDLAASAGLPYRVGRESRQEYNEPHAGRVYMRFGSTELLHGSTGEGDKAIQAFCFRLMVTKKEANRAPILKPSTYNREDYHYLLEDIRAKRITKFEEAFGVFPMPNGKFELNSRNPLRDTGVPSESLDLEEDNWAWPEASQAQRRKIYERYRDHNVGMVWMLQNDPAVPQSLREGALAYGWCRDEWTNNGYIPRQVYMREARRIRGLYNVTENDGNLDPALERTAVRPDSIAVVQWEFDSHGCHKFDPAWPGVREGYTFVPHPPLQVPYGTIVPQGCANVLVPVACSCSHVAYNAIRMEPVFMVLGEASGIAAHLAIEQHQSVSDISVDSLQRHIVARGGVLAYLEDVKFGDPDFAALHWLCARGFNQGYVARPDALLTVAEAAAAFQRVMHAIGKTWQAPATADGSAGGSLDGPMRAQRVQSWLTSVGFPGSTQDKRKDEDDLTVRTMAAILYRSMTGAKG